VGASYTIGFCGMSQSNIHGDVPLRTALTVTLISNREKPH
jgi:hypothetical protein